MDWQLGDLPLHPLIVHGAVVLVPLAALMLAVTAVWPAAARRLGVLTPIMAVVAAAFAFAAHSSGEALEHQVTETAAVEAHSEGAGIMNPVAVVLALAAVALWVWQRFARSRVGDGPRRALDIVAAILAVAVAVGAIVAVVLVGHSGATAVWGG